MRSGDYAARICLKVDAARGAKELPKEEETKEEDFQFVVSIQEEESIARCASAAPAIMPSTIGTVEQQKEKKERPQKKKTWFAKGRVSLGG